MDLGTRLFGGSLGEHSSFITRSFAGQANLVPAVVTMLSTVLYGLAVLALAAQILEPMPSLWAVEVCGVIC